MFDPHSRSEEILISIINGTDYTKSPQSRMEYLLLKLKEAISAGGGLTPEEIERLKREITDSVLAETEKVYEKMWFEGTRAEWNALSRTQKAHYIYVLILDEYKIYKYNSTTNTMNLAVNGDQPPTITNEEIDDILNNL